MDKSKSANLALSNDVFPQVKKLFNLPEHCKDVVIRMPLDGLVEIECTYYAPDIRGDLITRAFNLKPVDDGDTDG